MKLNHFPLRSIKTRVTLFTLAIFLLSTLALALYGRGILRDTIQNLLGEQQLATASIIAANVSQELDERHQAVAAVARSLAPLNLAISNNGPALQKRLEQHPNWQVLFNAGTFIVGRDGVATALLPAASKDAGARFKDWAFINSALSEGQTTLGQPPAAGPHPASLVGVAAPLRDRQGRVVGALVGLTDLATSAFLDKFTDSGYGQTGGYLLVSAQRRTVVAGNDRNGIMDQPPTAAASPLIERFLAGDEGSGVAVTARGIELLASAKAVPVAGWFTLVTLPLDDVFAPLRAARKAMLLASIVLALLASAAIWLILRREFAPMLATVRTLAKLTQSQEPPQPLAIIRRDEIDALIAGFNRLLAKLAQRQAALLAAETELRIAATAFESNEAMIVTDAHGVILRVNKAFTDGTGYSADEAVGQTPRLLKSGRHDSAFYRQMWETVNRTGSWQGEVWDRRKNGEIYPKWLTVSALKDDNGAVTHYVGAHFDITERKQKEEQIHQLAFYDPLTSLPNRRLFIDRLQQAMAAGKRNACHGAVMFLDLDNFKSLNDTRGHLAGDVLLIEAAQRLRHCVREVDTIARFGGDEFVVLINDLNADRAESAARTALVAEKVRAALSAPYQLTLSHEGSADTRFEHHCTASIGVALLINDGASPDDILMWADAAMYQAKAAGRNTIRFHDAHSTG